MSDEKLYQQASDEYESNNADVALLTKAIALCDGDEEKAKYKYIRLRVEQLLGSDTYTHRKEIDNNVSEKVVSRDDQKKSSTNEEDLHFTHLKEKLEITEEKQPVLPVFLITWVTLSCVGGFILPIEMRAKGIFALAGAGFAWACVAFIPIWFYRVILNNSRKKKYDSYVDKSCLVIGYIILGLLFFLSNYI